MANKATIAFRIALVVFICSILALGVIVFQYWSQDRAYGEIQEYVEVSDAEDPYLNVSVDWEGLRQRNSDIVGWVFIPDTKVNYPIVQGDDNEEYLHKAFDGTEGWLASAGTIFLDYLNNPDFSDVNNAIYGHHMNDGSMFACLDDWVDEEEFNNNRFIYVYTPDCNYRLTTFAVVKTTGDDDIVSTTFANQDAYEAYLQDKIDRSVVSQSVTKIYPQDIEKSFMFCTCEYTQSDGRLIVYAAVSQIVLQQ